jgi:ABC-type nitrate/sulfonate/bicarbonate transport system substrate-binding protein
MTTAGDTRGIVTASTESMLTTRLRAELRKWFRLFREQTFFELTSTALISRDVAHEQTWRFTRPPHRGGGRTTVGYQSPAGMAEQNIHNVKIIAGMYVGGQNLIMRKGVELKGWKDIEGKKIGRPPGTCAGVLFTLAAQANGVDLSKVNLVNTTPAGPPELQALKNGDLDGFILWSPIIDRAVIEGYGYYPPCCDIGATKEFGAGNQLLAANTDFLKDRKLAVTFLKAYVESMDFYGKNPDKTVALVAQYTGGSPAILDEAMKHSRWTYRVNVQNAINVAEEGPKFGFTKADMSGKVADYFDLSYLAEATGQSVEQLSSYGR